MPDQSPILLLTRPEPQSRSFLAECEDALGKSISTIISPVLEIVPVETDLNLEAYQTLVMTSRHAAEQMGRRLAGRKVVTVGKMTAEAAIAQGAEAKYLGEDVESFLENAGSVAPPALHLRGMHSRGHLAARLSRLGVPTEEEIVYDQVEQPLSERAKAALASGGACVPLFSPRSAALVSAYGAHPDTRVFAISRAAAEAWTSPGTCQIASSPDRAAMLDLVKAAF